VRRAAFAFLWIFVFSTPWENLYVIEGLGTAARLAGLVAFGAWVLAALDRRKMRAPSALHALMGLFVAWSVFTYFWSADPDKTLIQAGTYLQLFAMAWLIWELAPGLVEQRRLLGAFVLGGYVSSVGTLVSYAQGYSPQYQRFAARGFDPNELGLILALSVFMAVYLGANSTGWRRALYLLEPLVATPAIVLTGSRGATLALAAGFAALVVNSGALFPRRKAAIVAAALAAVTIAAVSAPPAVWKRLSTIGDEVSHGGTLNARTMIWQAGLDSFRESPVAGAGSGAYGRSVSKQIGGTAGLDWVAHNTFLSVLVETGAIGFALFAGVALSMWLGIWRLAPGERALWLSLALTWAVGVASLTWEYRKPTWFLLGIFAAQLAVAVRRKAWVAVPAAAWRPARARCA
jgi:O-antigen ligase